MVDYANKHDDSRLNRLMGSVASGASEGVGRLYLAGVTAFFFVGAFLAVLLRLELLTTSGGVLGMESFGRFLSMHGLVMLFLVAFPAIPGVLGNLLLPRMLGTARLALPRLNLAGFLLYLSGGLLLVASLLSGGLEGTWMMLPPFAAQESGGNLTGLLGVILAGSGLVCLSLVFLISFHRTRGVQWSRLRPFAWALYFGSFLSLLSFPVLLGVALLLLAGHFLGGSVFDAAAGGDAGLYRTIFWVFARPAFYAVILPPIGVVSEILDSKRIPQFEGDRILAGSMGAIAVLGLFGAGAHWMTSPSAGSLTLLSAMANVLTVVPFFLILIRWLQVLAAFRDQWGASAIFALSSIALALIGGFSGIVLEGPGINPHVHGTLFVVGHLHFLFAGTVLAAYIGGLHHWWADLSGRSFSQGLAVAGAVLLFVGVNVTFLPQFAAGMAGLPRRLPEYPAEFGIYQVLSTAGMTLLLAGYLVPILYLAWSLRFGDPAGRRLTESRA